MSKYKEIIQTEKSLRTFKDFLMRESAHESLSKLADEIRGNQMIFNDRVFTLNENQTFQDYIEGSAGTREDAAKLMKFFRKKGIQASRHGTCGILIKK